MGVRYLTVTEAEYKEFVGESSHENPRWLDFRRDDGTFSLGETVVILEFSYSLPGPIKTGYTGRMTARKIKQTVTGRIGISPGFIALLYEDTELFSEVEETARKIMAVYNPANGKIPT